MATAAPVAPLDIPTTLNYYKPIGTDPPFQYVYDPPEGQLATNVGSETHPVIIRDARDRQEEYGLSLDTSGFQYIKHTSVEKDFDDEERIQNVYYKEVEELLKKHTGAKRIFVFDHTIRCGFFLALYQ